MIDAGVVGATKFSAIDAELMLVFGTGSNYFQKRLAVQFIRVLAAQFASEVSFTPRLQPGDHDKSFNVGTVSTVCSGVTFPKPIGEPLKRFPDHKKLSPPG